MPNENYPIPLNVEVHKATIHKLKILSAIRGIPMYKLVDEVLTRYVEENLKNVPKP